MKLTTNFILFLNLVCFSISALADPPGRDDWQQPERIMDSIGVYQGMTIGEIGAGHGYFTFRLSERVGPDGKIYANDVQENVLEDIREKCLEQNIQNITTILGTTSDPQYADSSLDMSVMMIAFHDFEKPVEMLVNLKKSLRTGAKVYIIERDPDKWKTGHDHFWTEDKVVSTIEEAGYIIGKIFRFLPRDNIYECIPDASEE